ncbi:hypothetical protein KPH14_002832 [Odynerus spinipes]|uniref:Uncharacterized protein n=1 Tax=Odynerus spinipes TaxID=1348599 RepID=A0AAD9RG48_9HYME|nr:hypothetical protein KPH14_002832 [Odynerus spinipes]
MPVSYGNRNVELTNMRLGYMNIKKDVQRIIRSAKKMKVDCIKSDSWCHEPPIDDTVAGAILPVFENLLSSGFVETCLEVETQDSTESFNSTAWQLLP